jgi:hypothetical protein
MNREDIIRMAREAGFVDYELDDGTDEAFDIRYVRFAILVATAENEACAKVCDTTPPYPFRPSIEAAHAIRARGQA